MPSSLPDSVRWLLEPVILLRAFYLAAAALVTSQPPSPILAIQLLHPLRNRFLVYGSREAISASSSGPQAATEKRSSTVDQLLDSLASLRVPHGYFTHFYLVSCLSTVAWGSTIGLSNMCQGVQLAWLLMMLQGIRRLLESYAYMSSSKSTMWIGHWVLGVLFYLTVNVAIWIEDVPDSEGSQKPSFRVMLVAPAILISQALQHSYHAYLYRLRTSHSTYQLPCHPLFPSLLCPHYTCEILIYLLMAFLAVPTPKQVNWTLLCATALVAVNLGVTASGTKVWYEQRFGADKVRSRRRMIPWLW
ncbi:uncharacterized protein EI97DRAFT_451198 [Westerdykella ornata]|uniref:Polyprenal reductase n=1 Tax=Westerdykella ornata TaxID=318751 RepID=A0A6A6JG52_WESOR|nr:uncharacterized protein EI97DRAFT_451198 [Westerdykella ornata]KAF2274958.1 hypothetical protein EI97DRAFT_451198 [Westerdykella ornata]